MRRRETERAQGEASGLVGRRPWKGGGGGQALQTPPCHGEGERAVIQGGGLLR